MDKLENWDELDSFLKKVDQVDSILKGINSSDENLVKESMKKADKLIVDKEESELEVDGIKTKTGVNKTLINKSTTEQVSTTTSSSSSQDSFMRVLERDAQERSERRRQNTKLANELKEKGNVEFRAEKYEQAIEYYSAGIEKIKDMAVLYTNRAQAYIKLGKYDQAIVDCDWALRVDEKCVKALVHKGRALTYKKEFDKAGEEFEKARQLESTSSSSSSIDSFIKELQRCRVAHSQELAARLFLENEPVEQKENRESVNHFLDVLNVKLYRRDQSVLYYSGGIRYLASLCKNNDNHKVMFRTQNGLELFNSHFLVSKCLSQTIESLSQEECDLVSSILDLVQAICHNNDENLRILFETKSFTLFIEKLFVSKASVSSSMIDQELIKMLLTISDMEFGRELIITRLNPKKLVEYLIQSLNRVNAQLNDTTENAINILENLSLDSKFHAKIQTDDVQLICQVVKNRSKYSNRASCLAFTAVYALTNQQTFRNVIVKQNHVWEELLKTINDRSSNPDKDNVLLKLVLSLLVNMASIQSENLNARGHQISESLLRLYYAPLGFFQPQVLSSLSNILQKSQDSTRILALLYDNTKFVQSLVQNIKVKNGDLEHQSMKLLALCTQNDIKFCRLILDIDPKLDFLYAMFRGVSGGGGGEGVQEEQQQELRQEKVNIKKVNEPLINNCVLCMSHCVESSQEGSDSLTQTNIIMDLLYLTRDGFSRDMQKNCGILISKLVKKNDKHLIRLRELHGVEILYSALKDKI